jgi:hypothetical protein
LTHLQRAGDIAGEVGTQDRAELAPQIVRHPGGVLDFEGQDVQWYSTATLLRALER